MSFTGIPELREYHQKVGPLRFWSLISSTFAWIGIGVWLQISLNYPGAYGSSCRGKCMIEEYWFSSTLMSGGHRSMMELALFVWLWSVPLLVIGALIYAFVTKRGMFKKRESE